MLKDKFENYDIKINSEQINLFEKFLNIFKEKNSQINLSAIRDEESIIEKHFIDSVLLTKHFIDSVLLTKHCSLEGNILDLGTGGGFPGIPLSIIHQDKQVNFTLVDSIIKKVKVVNEFINELGLKNIKAISSRAEDLGQDLNHRGKYDIVVSRATAYLPTLLEYTIPLLKVGGFFISYKLDNNNEIKEAKKAFALLNCEVVEIKKYTLGGQKRAFLFIQKIGETHKKYPRTVGEPLKNPIK